MTEENNKSHATGKEMLLELIGGLVGWAWIGFSIYLIYLIYIALFSDGSWMNVFIVFVISVILKAITRILTKRA
jgi:hypothetical protein